MSKWIWPTATTTKATKKTLWLRSVIIRWFPCYFWPRRIARKYNNALEHERVAQQLLSHHTMISNKSKINNNSFSLSYFFFFFFRAISRYDNLRQVDETWSADTERYGRSDNRLKSVSKNIDLHHSDLVSCHSATHDYTGTNAPTRLAHFGREKKIPKILSIRVLGVLVAYELDAIEILMQNAR